MATVTLLQIIQEHRSAADVFIDEVGRRMNITCRRGCHHCCYLMPMVSLPEAAVIYDSIGQERFDSMKQKFEDELKLLKAVGFSSNKLFENKYACTFLTGGQCSIYEDRPLTCRVHVVASDPKFCSPDDKTAGRLMLDQSVFFELISEGTAQASDAMGFSTAFALPLSWALIYVDLWNRDEHALRARMRLEINDIFEFMKMRAEEDSGSVNARFLLKQI